jgi:hypothetical protein
MSIYENISSVELLYVINNLNDMISKLKLDSTQLECDCIILNKKIEMMIKGSIIGEKLINIALNIQEKEKVHNCVIDILNSEVTKIKIKCLILTSDIDEITNSLTKNKITTSL